MNIIRADRRSDILKEKSEYEEDYKNRKSKYESQYENYSSAREAITDSVIDAIKAQLGDLIYDLNITIQANFSIKGDSIEIRVTSNDYNHDDSVALSWNYNVEVQDGEVKQETGSWSGLNAVTHGQIDSLEKTIQALKILNNIDWDQLVNQSSPAWDEYVTEKNPDWGEKPNFDEQLRQLDLEEAVGTNTAFKASEGKLYRGPVYYRIDKVSGIRYYLTEYPARRVEQGDFSEHSDTTMNYNTLMQYLITPYVTVEVK